MNKDKPVEVEIKKLPRCPHCRSKYVELIEIKRDNGVFGPGFQGWVIDSYHVCKKCGSMFKRIFNDYNQTKNK